MTMRAKFKVFSVKKFHNESGEVDSVSVEFYAVGRNESYPADGVDENNTFARWTPSANLQMTVLNPALFDSFTVDDEFYADFTPAPK